MDALMDALKDLILAGLTLAITFAANAIRAWFEENKNNKKLQSINEALTANEKVVSIAVAAIEQTVTHLHGDEKLEAAKDRVIAILNEKGLPISEAEVDALIHKAVKEMNDVAKRQ